MSCLVWEGGGVLFFFTYYENLRNEKYKQICCVAACVDLMCNRQKSNFMLK